MNKKYKNKAENYFRNFDYKDGFSGMKMGALILIGAMILLVVAKILIYVGVIALAGYGIYYLTKKKDDINKTKKA